MSTEAAGREYEEHGPPLWLRAIWFVLVGWWLTGVAIAAAYLLLVTIIGIPVAFWLFDRVPLVLTLKPHSARSAGAVTGGHEQASLLARAAYFVLVGWWLGAIWIIAAYAVCVTIIGIPLGVIMFNAVPTVVTLQRN
jgi:uncharacterized membrane protein YccF (DUF307 family)